MGDSYELMADRREKTPERELAEYRARMAAAIQAEVDAATGRKTFWWPEEVKQAFGRLQRIAEGK